MPRLRPIATAIAAAISLVILAASPALAQFGDEDIRSIQSFTKRMLERAKTGSSTTWRNGDGSIGGRVTITTTDHRPGAQPCRTYEWTMRRQGGAEMTGIGRGCRDAAGNWTLEENRSERQSSIDPPPAPAKVYPPNSQTGPSTTTGPTQTAKPPAAQKPDTAAKADPAPEDEPEAAAAPPPAPAEQLANLEFTIPPRTLAKEVAEGKATDAEGAQ